MTEAEMVMWTLRSWQTVLSCKCGQALMCVDEDTGAVLWCQGCGEQMNLRGQAIYQAVRERQLRLGL